MKKELETKINGMEFARYIASELLTDSNLNGDKYYAMEDKYTEIIKRCFEDLEEEENRINNSQLNLVVDYFNSIVNSDILNHRDYLNDRDWKYNLRTFENAVKDDLDITFGSVIHANGIGNNNEYPIIYKGKVIGKYYYCVGIYGGASAYIYDTNNHQRAMKGRAR